MSPQNLKRVNDLFAEWQGARVEFNQFFTSMGPVFGIAMWKDGASLGVQFSACFYIQGPTSWENGNLVCSSWHDADGYACFEVRDVQAGFLVRAGGGVTAGDGRFAAANAS